MASRNFDTRQSLERQIKSLYGKVTYAPTAATVSLPTTTPIVLTKAAASSLYNGNTYQTVIDAPAANPLDSILAVWTGSAAATVLTITPNDGTNNPTVAATGTLATTTPIVLTKVVFGEVTNGYTVTTAINAAAANPTDTILCDVTGTAAAITITITPNDGTNNGATPVDLTTAELAELITNGTVVGKTVTVTDAGSLLDDQTATGGGADVVVAAGEGDALTALFAGGVNTAVTLTTAEVVELINTGGVVGKNVTVTDASLLRALATATGGDTTDIANGGEADIAAQTFAGATDFTEDNTYGIYSVGLTAAGTIRIYLDDKYVALRYFGATLFDATARDFTTQIKAYDVNPSSGRAYIDFYTLTGGTATTIPTSAKIVIDIDIKNTTVI